MFTRRQFLVGSLAFGGLTASGYGKASSFPQSIFSDLYGPLIPDPQKRLDLPKGFTYQVISSLGDMMSDGLQVPDRADGMGCFALADGQLALVRNHELQPEHIKKQPATIQKHKTELAYDTFESGVTLPGGTTTLVFDPKSQKVTHSFKSISGTVRNCAGGITPWNSWLTCEESVGTPGSDYKQYHGYVFEVPADATSMVEAVPLKAMGRFNHEAACVDPKTGIVYLTEDRGDSLFYRFIPNEYGKLQQGGTLQALRIKDTPKFDSRNWAANTMSVGEWLEADWVTLDTPDGPEDDLRKRGYELGATLFARGEGIHWANNELYFCCTNGGKKQLGQIMRFAPGQETSEDRIQLFLESEDKNLFNFGDNLTVCPNGHLLVCEDQYTDVVDNHLRGVTPQGDAYAFAKLHRQTELAGACFSPDGKILFVNLYSPTETLAIYGPWEQS
ncbi:alkaline phosphatase PhoX [Alteromonas sp. 14N.309.X.WAT.G.H12]|uniref:alkaline phosphatase PhoX n=1 Tax=Alteromonas sp. 14N.309.X.WAT.G.H12 TaxID=3120824 RepID=UPI002FD01E93